MVEIVEDFDSMFYDEFVKKYGVIMKTHNSTAGLLKVLESLGYKGVK